MYNFKVKLKTSKLMKRKLLSFRLSNSILFLKSASIVCVLTCISCSKLASQNTKQTSIAPVWVLVEEASDEFNKTELDTDKWKKGLWYNTSGKLAFKESNVSVSEGNLVLIAKKENYNEKEYTYGAVESKFDIPGANSYVEVRAKVLSREANVLSAIWLQSSPLSRAQNPNPEIDIMESFNYYKYTQALHTWHKSKGHVVNGSHDWDTGVDISEKYHLYKLERIDGKLKFYFDGVLAWETTPAESSFVSMKRHMVLSLEGHLGDPVADQLPKSFLIDYVRTYSCAREPPN